MNETLERTPDAGEPMPPASNPADAPSPASIDTEKRTGRRGFVAAAAAGAGLLALGARSLKGGAHAREANATPPPTPAQPATPTSRPVATSALRVNPADAWKSPELRLVRRITMGLTEAEARRALQMGYDAYLDYQCHYTAIDDSALESDIAHHLPTLAMGPAEIWKNTTLKNTFHIYAELVEATFRRSLESNRQLYQRMVEFWHDHFSMTFDKVPFSLTIHDRDVIRVYALDTFPNLLKATAHSPAMMRYLDNADAQKNQPNQNYARELMELMTLGVDGGYTQQDVIEVARCFTGWSMNEIDTAPADPANQTLSLSGQPANDAPVKGAFQYKPEVHDDGEKTVLGHTIPAGGGKSDGDFVLDMLSLHPNTARHIAKKLCVWLLQYDPPQSVVESVAQTYLSTGGDIRAMIKVILAKPNLMAAPAKYKRPYHLIVSALRATGTRLAPVLSKDGWMGEHPLRWPKESAWLGQRPFWWPEPDGYPDSLDYWAGLLLPRLNFGALLAANHLPGFTCDVSRLVRAGTPAAVVEAIDQMLYAGEMPAPERNDLLEFLRHAAQNPVGESTARQALAFALASPAFQWY